MPGEKCKPLSPNSEFTARADLFIIYRKIPVIITCILKTVNSRLSLSRSRRDPLKHFEISVLRHIRFAELRKIPIEQPNFTNEYVI